MNDDLKSGMKMLEEIKNGAVPPELAICEAEAIIEYINKLQQENQQLKEQLQNKYDNFPRTVKDLTKEQLEGFFLDLLHVDDIHVKELNRAEEVIDKAIRYIYEHGRYLGDGDFNEYLNFQTELPELLEILQRYKGDNK